MARFGNETIAAATFPLSDNRSFVSRHTLSESATLQSIHYYIGTASGASGNSRGVIYNDDGTGTAPTTVRFVGNPSGTPTGSGWVTSVVTGTLPPGTYWLGSITTGSLNGNHHYAESGGGGADYWSANNYTTPATWPFPDTTYPAGTSSVYVEYEPAGSGVVGSLVKTLGSAAVAAVGAVALVGSLAAILAPSGVSALGATPIAGSSARTLTAASVASDGGVAIAGAVSASLLPAQLVAMAGAGNRLSVILAPSILNAAGDVLVSGAMAATFAPAILDSDTVSAREGVLAAVLAPTGLVAHGPTDGPAIEGVGTVDAVIEVTITINTLIEGAA